MGIRQLTAGREQGKKHRDLTLNFPSEIFLAEIDQKPRQSSLNDAIHKGQQCRIPSMTEEDREGIWRGKQNLSNTVPSRRSSVQ